MQIPRVILGCGNFGGIGSAPAFHGMGEDEPTARALMDHAWERGIFAFDTADAYGGGRSETYIGNWIAEHGSAVRDRLVLTTKVFNPVGPGPNERGLSRVHILRQIDASLKRLRTDRVDVYLIHEPDPLTPIEETLGAMDDIVRAGKAVEIGGSNIEAWRLERARGTSATRGWRSFRWVQNNYSLLERGVERELLPYCAESGTRFTAFSPLAGGWLTGKYRGGGGYPSGSRMTLRPEPYLHLQGDKAAAACLTNLETMARDRHMAMASVALAWLLQQPHVAAAVIGPRRVPHIDDAMAALDLTLTAGELVRLTGPDRQ